MHQQRIIIGHSTNRLVGSCSTLAPYFESAAVQETRWHEPRRKECRTIRTGTPLYVQPSRQCNSGSGLSGTLWHDLRRKEGGVTMICAIRLVKLGRVFDLHGLILRESEQCTEEI